MPTDTTRDNLLPLPEGAFAGRDAFQAALRLALVHAAAQGWPELVLCDADFDDWPLGERDVLDALQRWAKAGRKLTLLAGQFEPLQRRHHRFVQFRQRWAHLIECRSAARSASFSLLSALWSPVWVLQRNDPLHCTGQCSTAASRRVALREEIDGLLQRSRPGFPATTLGL